MPEKCIEYLEKAKAELEKTDMAEADIAAHSEIIDGLIADIKADYDEENQESPEEKSEEEMPEEVPEETDDELEKKAYDHLGKQEEEKKKGPMMTIVIGHKK